MPTTCGFPNCKFRSRYRGQEDNRHFYRIPKRPLVLRQRWLHAIGRTEETVVSQLRICSAHFKDGEKREGDIPVPDPEHDTPISIQLPPKETKASEKRRQKGFGPSKCFNLTASPLASMGSLYERLGLGDPNQVALAFANALKCASEQNQTDSRPPSTNSLLLQGPPVESVNGERCKGSSDSAVSPLSQFLLHPLHAQPDQPGLLGPDNNTITLSGLNSRLDQQLVMRPLVALLDGRDCAIEMSLLKDVATVAFCDAQNASEIHQRVLNEAVVALAYHSIELEREDLRRFKRLKALIRIGPSTENIDVEAATELGIAICTTSSQCVEELADSAMSFILNVYRKTVWLSRYAQLSPRTQGIEGLRELAAGTKRPSGSTLLVVGLGTVGLAVAHRAKAFGFHISFYDPNIPEGFERALGLTRFNALEEAVATADCITFHCPLNSITKRMVNMSLLKCMKKGVFIVSVNSDQLFVESDLIAGLRSGQVLAAALDCQSIGKPNVLSTLPNVIATPRMAWYSESSCKELREAASMEARRVIKGEDPFLFKKCVNQQRAAQSLNNATTTPAAVATTVPTIPSFSSTNNFLGFPLVNSPMMMWPPSFAAKSDALFPQLQEQPTVEDRSNGSRSAGLAEDRPSSSTSGFKEERLVDEAKAERELSTEPAPSVEVAAEAVVDEPPLKMLKTMDEGVRAS